MSNPFLRAYEFERRYNLERLRHTLEQAEAALKEFRPETIDFAKSALETICKAVLAERGVTTVKGQEVAALDFPPLVKEALKALGCHDEQLRAHLGGLAHSMAETRNRETVAGHGQEGDKAFIGKPGITLFMLTFSTILEAMMGLLEAETPDLMTTKLTFDAAEERLGLGPGTATSTAGPMSNIPPRMAGYSSTAKNCAPAKSSMRSTAPPTSRASNLQTIACAR